MYRDDSASLEERHRMLRRSLDENRARAHALRNEQAMLHQELATLHRELGAETNRPKRALPLANIVVASPCDVPWESMVGNERTRHCGACKKDVHNLSAMTRDEVEAFLARAEVIGAQGGVKPCVSLFQRLDGTILTADCPIGVRRRRLRALLATTMGLGVAALMAFTALALLQSEAPPLSSDDPSTLVPVSMTTSSPTASAGFGQILIDGPSGTIVFENGNRLGVVPMTMTASSGAHAYQFTSGTETRWETAIIPDRGTTHLYVSFSPPPIVPPIRRGGVVAPPPSIRGGL
jgi:hypothetical protein